jgi:hypothetical protein
VRARRATVLWLLHDARAALRASAARLCAGGPGVPAASDAVARARVRIARARLSIVRASGTAVDRLSVVACATLRATTARLRACGPGVPVTDDAVLRAAVPVARARFRSVRARRATVLWLLHDARAALRAGTARLGTRCPCAEVTEDAIARARELVAFALLLKVWTSVATVAHARDDRAGARLSAAQAARLRARRPGAELSDDAMDRTRVLVAHARLLQHARLATVVLVGHNGAATALCTTVARLGACGPRVPGCGHTVNRARMRVARHDLRTVRARHTTERRMRQLAHALAVARIARGRARPP